MKFFVALLILIFSLGIVGKSDGQTRTTPIGLWLKKDEDTNQSKAIIELYEKDDRLYGRIHTILLKYDEMPTCTDCPGEQKNVPLQGLVLLEDFVQDEDEWVDGRILRPKNGKYYDGKIWVEDGKLAVRGYMGILYKTQYWEPYNGK